MSTTATFAEYSAVGFDRANRERLLVAARALDDRCVHVVVSNSGVTYGRYDAVGVAVDWVDGTQFINSDETSRGAVDGTVATVPPGECYGQASIEEF
jgi:DNA adenine methylase